jgi:NADP-dependent 3-hydroxy acid dehydrogenase YdfG
MNLSNKVALITGAGTGIGKACALKLLNNNYQVVLVGRRFELLEAVIKDHQISPDQAMAYSLDISQANQVQSLFTKIKLDASMFCLITQAEAPPPSPSMKSQSRCGKRLLAQI